MDAAVLGDTAERLAANSRWDWENRPYWSGEVDCCINASTIASGAWLGVDVSGLVTWFLEHRMTDGGWNCEWIEGSKVSSFHSTLNALKGLLYYESVTGGTDEIRAARRGGEEYLLHGRVLPRRLDFEERSPDPRMTEAIEQIRAARQPDGTWIQAGRDPGRVWFEVDVEAGEPSKWITHSATRVLEWWDASDPAAR